MTKPVTSITVEQVTQLSKYEDCAEGMLVYAQRFRYNTEECLVDTRSLAGEMARVTRAVELLSRAISASLEAVSNLQYNIEEIIDEPA